MSSTGDSAESGTSDRLSFLWFVSLGKQRNKQLKKAEKDYLNLFPFLVYK